MRVNANKQFPHVSSKPPEGVQKPHSVYKSNCEGHGQQSTSDYTSKPLVLNPHYVLKITQGLLKISLCLEHISRDSESVYPAVSKH